MLRGQPWPWDYPNLATGGQSDRPMCQVDESKSQGVGSTDVSQSGAMRAPDARGLRRSCYLVGGRQLGHNGDDPAPRACRRGAAVCSSTSPDLTWASGQSLVAAPWPSRGHRDTPSIPAATRLVVLPVCEGVSVGRHDAEEAVLELICSAERRFASVKPGTIDRPVRTIIRIESIAEACLAATGRRSATRLGFTETLLEELDRAVDWRRFLASRRSTMECGPGSPRPHHTRPRQRAWRGVYARLAKLRATSRPDITRGRLVLISSQMRRALPRRSDRLRLSLGCGCQEEPSPAIRAATSARLGYNFSVALSPRTSRWPR